MSVNQNESHCNDWSLSQWLCYLETIHSQEIDLGLTRITQVAKNLSISLGFAKVITVAGTNGKGTTCAFIENHLLSQGKSVAVYSSPHIESFNERLRINRLDVNDAPWISAFENIEQARGDISLTYYEYTTLAAFLILMECRPNYIILEVGLGGRLDATNMIDADIAVLTSVDLDHQAFLGNTREAIGKEKAGIFRKNVPAVIGEAAPPTTVIEYAEQIGANLIQRQQGFWVKEQSDDHLWSWKSDALLFNNLVFPNIPLDNVATAIAVLQRLGITLTSDNINQTITSTKVAGRTEVFHLHCDVMLDVGHNPHAAEYLASQLKRLKYAKVRAVVGMLKDKDIKKTLAALANVVDCWYFSSLSGERAATSKDIEQIVDGMSLGPSNCFDNVKQAYTMAKTDAQPNELVLVFGSFFTVAEIRPLLLS